MANVPTSSLEALVRSWSEPRTLETPEARGARERCARELLAEVRATKRRAAAAKRSA